MWLVSYIYCLDIQILHAVFFLIQHLSLHLRSKFKSDSVYRSDLMMGLSAAGPSVFLWLLV